MRVKCIGAAPAVLLLYRGGAEPPTPLDPHSTMSTVRPDNCQVVQVTPTIPCGIRNCNKRSVRTRALTRFTDRKGRYCFYKCLSFFSEGGVCLLLPTKGAYLLGGLPNKRGSASWRPPPSGHCRGRYASYWNAFFLFLFVILGVGNVFFFFGNCKCDDEVSGFKGSYSSAKMLIPKWDSNTFHLAKVKLKT